MKQSSNAVVPRGGNSAVGQLKDKPIIKELQVESKSSSQREVQSEIQSDIDRQKPRIADRKLRNQKSMGEASHFKITNTVHPTNVSFSNDSHTFLDS